MWDLIVSVPDHCLSFYLTAKLERRILTLEMRCYWRLLNVSYKDHETNREVYSMVNEHSKASSALIKPFPHLSKLSNSMT